MRLSKQLDQIFQLANEFDYDESDPVSMTVDECWIHTGNVAGVHEHLLCSDPSFVQCGDGCDELPDGVGVVVLDGILTDFYCKFLVQDGISDECRSFRRSPEKVFKLKTLKCCGIQALSSLQRHTVLLHPRDGFTSNQRLLFLPL